MHAVDLLSMVQNLRFSVSEKESNQLIQLNRGHFFLAPTLHTSCTFTGNAMHQSEQERKKTTFKLIAYLV